MYECACKLHVLYDEIIKSDKNNNFRPKATYDLLSYFQFQTDLFFHTFEK